MRQSTPPDRSRLAWLFQPIAIAPLVYFRCVAGFFMACQAWLFLAPTNGTDEIERVFTNVPMHFPYPFLEWLRPLPDPGMHVLFVLLVLAGIGVLLGLWYRWCAAFFCLGFGYAFFSDTMVYQNHYYLLILISFLLVCIPANRALSLDVYRRPALRSPTAPRWAVDILRFQIGVVYFYGGLAKLNHDWLHGEPMRHWLAKPERTGLPLIGKYFTEEWFVMLFSYSGLLLDLLVVPALLWRRTRVVALGVVTLFHLLNHLLWTIKIFPWFMILATFLFLPPSSFRWLTQRGAADGAAASADRQTGRKRAVVALLGVYVLLQLVLPLRHLLYPGDPSWTEEGALFAWRMKLRSKGLTGEPRFQIRDAQGRIKEFGADGVLEVMSPHQMRYMSIKPEALHYFSRALARGYERSGHGKVQVRVAVYNYLNTRKPQLLIDPTVDLAAQPYPLGHAFWIMPLTEPLPERP